MAKVTITISDEGEEADGKNTVTIKLESDPAFPGPAAEDQTITSAQNLGLNAWQAIAEMAAGKKGNVELESGDDDEK
jgi:hypothetical protein